MPLVILIWHTPNVNRGLNVNSSPFLSSWRWKRSQKPALVRPLLASEQWLSRWWCPVVSSIALDILHQAMCTVSYRPIAMTIETTSKLGVFFHSRLFACCPGGRRDNMEQVVTQWQLPGASSVSLVMLYWVMPSALLQCVRMAIKMAHDGGTCVRHRHLFCFCLL
jgi:hypothetical protein